MKWWRERPPRSPYLTAFIKIKPPLAGELCGVRDSLRRVDRRQIYSSSSYLHVTVKELGWLGDAVTHEGLPGILNGVHEVAQDTPPFDLAVDGVGIFPTVIYGRVGSGTNEVRRMNAQLVESLSGRAIQSKYDGEKMIPHVTLAHFATSDAGPLLAHARSMRSRRIGMMKVTEIGVGKWFPRRLFERPHRPTPLVEPLAGFKLSHS